MDILKVLEESIIKVFDNNGNEIPFNTKEIKMSRAKYSSTGRETPTLFLDGVPLINNGTKKRKVEYKCVCGSVEKILLCKFLSKKKLSCTRCREKDLDKIALHKLYFEKRRNGEKLEPKKRQTKVYDFENETEEFKKNYFTRNLTKEEFQKSLKYIYSIDDIVLKENDDIKLLLAEPAPNAKKYSQYVLINGEKHRFHNLFLRCPICGEIFHITRPFKERVNNHNFDCRKCFLNNKTFAVKKINDILNYQGQTELYFINKCLSHGIEIVNGDKVPYVFSDRKHIYTIDFKLPHYAMEVEIKDNHVWHRKQVETGKWAAKEKAAKKYCTDNHLTYYLLFPKDIDAFFEHLKEIV